MLRLLWLVLLVYLLWRLYLRFIRTTKAKERRLRLEDVRARVRPSAELFPIHYVSAGGESFRQLSGEMPGEGAALVVLEHGTQSGADGAHIVGSLQNMSGKTFSAVEVVLELYNHKGDSLATTVISKAGLNADQVWSFRAKVARAEASHYKIAEIRGF